MCALNRIFSEVRAVAVILVAMMFVQGCATAPPRANPLPEELAYTAEIPGIPLARSYADEGPEYVRKWIESMSDEESGCAMRESLIVSTIFWRFPEEGRMAPLAPDCSTVGANRERAPSSRW